jgi:Uma2 family endonuclease
MSESHETPPSLPPPQAGAEGGLTSAGLRRTLNSMSQRYPRAPSSAAWAAMSPEEQARVHASLPGEVTEEEWGLPEGDWHFHAKKGALEALRTAFAEVLRRKAYVAADLPVYYPDARRFAPDLLVVLDVEPYFRNRWDVNWEKKKLDFILEVHVDGDRKKDTVRNVKRYAALKVPEYFIFDQKRGGLEGYRLEENEDPEAPGRYQRLVPQGGRYHSEPLGVDLVVEEGRLRFYIGDTLLLEFEELVAQLRLETQQWKARALEEAKRREAAEKALEEKARELQQAREEIARLKSLLH